MRTVEQLIKEYQEWCEAKGYPKLSADELLVETQNDELLVQGSDREWLIDFIMRWESLEYTA